MGNSLNSKITLEFFGVPGSGKSTIAHSLADLLQENGYSVQEKSYIVNGQFGDLRRIILKLRYTFIFTIFHPLFLLELFSMIDKNVFFDLKEKIKQWVNVCFVLYNYKKKNNRQFFIADQGLIQAAISLTIHCKEVEIAQIIKKMSSVIEMPKYIIYVNIKEDKSLYRLKTRINGKSRVDKEKSEEKRIKELKKVADMCEDILLITECVSIDNSEDNMVDNICEKLYSILVSSLQ